MRRRIVRRSGRLALSFEQRLADYDLTYSHSIMNEVDIYLKFKGILPRKLINADAHYVKEAKYS